MTHLSPIENLFAVEVPGDAEGFEMCDYLLEYSQDRDGYTETRYINLWPGSYEILFTTKNCSEEQAADVLGEPPYCNYVPQNLLDPNREDIWLNIIESFNSLLRANGLQPETNYLLIKKIA